MRVATPAFPHSISLLLMRCITLWLGMKSLDGIRFSPMTLTLTLHRGKQRHLGCPGGLGPAKVPLRDTASPHTCPVFLVTFGNLNGRHQGVPPAAPGCSLAPFYSFLSETCLFVLRDLGPGLQARRHGGGGDWGGPPHARALWRAVDVSPDRNSACDNNHDSPNLSLSLCLSVGTRADGS